MYTDGTFEQNDSFYYKLGEGYRDHVLDNSAISAGGNDFALDLMNYIYSLFYEYDLEAETSQMAFGIINVVIHTEYGNR